MIKSDSLRETKIASEKETKSIGNEKDKIIDHFDNNLLGTIRFDYHN